MAASMLGWENLFHCEINPFGKAVLDYWYPKAKSYDDITKTDFRQWRGRVNVLTGGFPCQPFSYAGKRRGADDDRYLWPSMYRCIDEIRPDWVVAENVAGILTMVEQGEVVALANQTALFGEADDVRGIYQLRETFTLERICNDLESHGYSVQPVLIPACGVGAPHRRDRVFIIGHRIAPDSNQCADRRAPREDESESREEWLQKRHEIRQSIKSSQVRPESEGDAFSSHTSDDRLERQDESISKKSNRGGYVCESRWANFPSVSPIHRGNDGLPFNVDNLTIPFQKWRTEALKAYGNAIVPQVMYEIFRAIQEVESQK